MFFSYAHATFALSHLHSFSLRIHYIHSRILGNIKLITLIAFKELICRIDVGGKLLTNLLKEWSSYRHLNVMEETYVMNECKEDICYVASDFREEMKLAKYVKASF